MATLAANQANRLEEDGHQVFQINVGSGKSGIFFLPLLYFRFVIAILHVDIVQVISASGLALWTKDLPALLLARLFRKVAIMEFVGGAAVDKIGDWGWLKRLPFYVAHTVVVPTEMFRNALKKANVRAKFVVIPHTVDVAAFGSTRLVKSDLPILLVAKALVPYAGHDLLIDVMERVQVHFPQAELWIAGDGPSREALEQRVKDKNISGIRFLGRVDYEDMSALMAQAKILVHATKYESFGISLVEAMASGLPVIAFAVGGIPDVVADNETGYLVPYGDTTMFADKIVALLKSPTMLDHMSTQARENSQRFSWHEISQHWYKLYANR